MNEWPLRIVLMNKLLLLLASMVMITDSFQHEAAIVSH